MTVMISWLENYLPLSIRVFHRQHCGKMLSCSIQYYCIIKTLVKSNQRSRDFWAFQSTSAPSQALVMNPHDQIFVAGLPEYDCTVNTTLSLVINTANFLVARKVFENAGQL